MIDEGGLLQFFPTPWRRKMKNQAWLQGCERGHKYLCRVEADMINDGLDPTPVDSIH